VTETGRLIPNEDKLAAVDLKEPPFGLSQAIFQSPKHQRGAFWAFNCQGTFSYTSGNDIARLVKTLIFNVLGAIGLIEEVEVHSKVGTFGIRQELLTGWSNSSQNS
jgi:hypothetical protein